VAATNLGLCDLGLLFEKTFHPISAIHFDTETYSRKAREAKAGRQGERQGGSMITNRDRPLSTIVKCATDRISNAF